MSIEVANPVVSALRSSQRTAAVIDGKRMRSRHVLEGECEVVAVVRRWQIMTNWPISLPQVELGGAPRRAVDQAQPDGPVRLRSGGRRHLKAKDTAVPGGGSMNVGRAQSYVRQLRYGVGHVRTR
jgi:hypothetical protein